MPLRIAVILAVALLIACSSGEVDRAVERHWGAPATTKPEPETKAPDHAETPSEVPHAPQTALNDTSRYLQWASGAFLLLAVPVGLLALLPGFRRDALAGAATCLVVGMGIGLLRIAWLSHGMLTAGVVSVLAAVLGTLTIIPILVPWYRARYAEAFKRKAEHLIEKGKHDHDADDVRSGAAAVFIAEGLTGEDEASRRKRRARMVEMGIDWAANDDDEQETAR